MSVFNKHAVVTELLKNGVVRLMVATRTKGVVVPKEHVDKGIIALDIGLNMPVPIRDLEIAVHNGISGTLSFDSEPFWCCIPWHSLAGVAQSDTIQVAWGVEDDDEEPQPDKPKLKLVTDD